MIVGERMKLQMELIEISQSELARRTGLTQGTIAGLISGRSRSSAHLHKIARELRTTPSYLEGEIDDPELEGVPTIELSADQRELVERFEAMTPADQRAVMQVARSMAEGGGARRTLHDSAMDLREETNDRRRGSAGGGRQSPGGDRNRQDADQ